mmetsp:Transcript_46705/g.105947  ORF Transcript_46705/g.105947 Transcript_46705/m.105947 type:complete len:212 (-) Transcript_46705:131-766(-)
MHPDRLPGPRLVGHLHSDVGVLPGGVTCQQVAGAVVVDPLGVDEGAQGTGGGLGGTQDGGHRHVAPQPAILQGGDHRVLASDCGLGHQVHNAAGEERGGLAHPQSMAVQEHCRQSNFPIRHRARKIHLGRVRCQLVGVVARAHTPGHLLNCGTRQLLPVPHREHLVILGPLVVQIHHPIGLVLIQLPLLIDTLGGGGASAMHVHRSRPALQ